MNDIIEKLDCGSLIQHGAFNDRIYLLEASDKDLKTLPERLIKIAEENGYGKIFAKINESKSAPFLAKDFVPEARIPGMYPDNHEALFLAYYLDKARKEEGKKQIYEKNLQLALKKKKTRSVKQKSDKFTIRTCTEDDLPRMKEIYEKVFKTYPFPIHDISYLRQMMTGNLDYFCIEKKGKIVALASAEKNKENKYCEMTDFATMPDWRGRGYAQYLLQEMEEAMKKQGYKTAFTIARAISPGMNITFAKAAYTFAGRLKNNTNISGNIESMNIWYKDLVKHES
ncbi:MAG: putative beta-lysine N-acetyltransferase [Candidatus Neomarinimicrobiota bacterium]